MNRLVLLILLLAAAVLFLGWETHRAWNALPASDNAAASGEAAVPAVAADNASDAPRVAEPAAAAQLITNKPVFRPDRQPYREVVIQAVAPQRNYDAELSRFHVLGVLFLDGVDKALVTGKGNGGAAEHWEVGAGDSLPGFSVKEIRQEGVLLTADDREFVLPLYAGGPRGAAVPRNDAAQAASPGLPPGMTPPVPPQAHVPAVPDPADPRRRYSPTLPQRYPPPGGVQAVPPPGGTAVPQGVPGDWRNRPRMPGQRQ